MAKLYKGDSAGFSSVVSGYLDYSYEVVKNRAIPDIRDGLKPVHRRILFATNKNMKLGESSKAQPISGYVMKYHPHGDSAIYDAFTRMVDTNGSWNVPMFYGEGNLGSVLSSAPAAAPRYPDVKLHENTKDFFGLGMDAVPFVDNELGSGPSEPSVLPINYPFALVAGAQGLAVGVATNIPSFNFWEVLDLVEKRIRSGKLGDGDYLYPDFPTGGHYIVNSSEAAKIAYAGKGTVKIRADVDIRGNEILVKEIPVGTTIDKIKKTIISLKDLGQLPNVKSASISRGMNSECLITIECKSKSVVESVLLDLYRRRILQNTFAANMLFINDEMPVYAGVFNVIERWYHWRKSIVEKDITNRIADIASELSTLDYFIKLVNDDAHKTEYLRLLTKVSKKAAGEYLTQEYPGIPIDTADWIGERTASAFLNGGTYKNRFDALTKTHTDYVYDLGHLDEVLLRDLDTLRKEHKGQHERKTKVTNFDYNFTKAVPQEDEEKEQDRTPATFVITKDGFIRKLARQTISAESDDSILSVVQGTASTTLIGFDNMGRVLKVYGEDLPFTRGDGHGTFVFRYTGDSDNEAIDLARLVYMGELDGKTRMLLFTDGKVSFLDTEKWVNAKAHHKVVTRGVNLAVGVNLMEVFEEDEIPAGLIVLDDGNPKKLRMASIPVKSILRKKSSTAQSVAFKGSGTVHLKYWGALTEEQLNTWLANETLIENYNQGTLRFLPGGPSDLEGVNDTLADDFDIMQVMNEPRFSTPSE